MSELDTLERPEVEGLESKSFDAYIKADASGKTMEFSAIVSVFDIPDNGGDIVRKGAFLDTLADFKTRDRKIPVVWSHGYRNLADYLGTVTEAKELDPGDSLLPPDIKAYGGLYVAGVFDDDPPSLKAYKLLKGGRINEFSFAYTITEAQYITVEGKEYRELLKIGLWEVGPTIRGLHPSAQTVAVKTHLPRQESPASIESPASLAIAEARLKLARLR